MSETTNIQWCDSSWSPWLGCSKVSPGCKNCYITTTTPFRTRNLKHGEPRQRTSASYWKQPVKWNRDIQKWRDQPCDPRFRPAVDGHPNLKVFPSLCDWLDPEVPIEWFVDYLFLMFKTKNLNWLNLTKRIENFLDRLYKAKVHYEARNGADDFVRWLFGWFNGEAPSNIWIGVSVEDQKRADERIPQLLKIPAWVRFLSVEPLLGPVKICQWMYRKTTAESFPQFAKQQIDWVIVGGESGPGARPCNVEWIRSVVRQCKAAGVPCFVKQLGSVPKMDVEVHCESPALAGLRGVELRPLKLKHSKGGDPAEWPEELRVREWPA